MVNQGEQLFWSIKCSTVFVMSKALPSSGRYVFSFTRYKFSWSNFAGGLNSTFSPLDRSSPRVIPQARAVQTIELFRQTYGVTDVWHYQNPTSRCYSFFSHVHKTFSHIDYFLIGNRFLPIISKCEYQTTIISDHAPLLMRLDMPTSQDNYRPWHLNNLWLSDACFVQFISSEISAFMEYNKTPGMSSSTIWESMKAHLRGQIISY